MKIDKIKGEVVVTFLDGRTYTIAELSRLTGVSETTIGWRIRRKVSEEKLLLPKRQICPFEVQGQLPRKNIRDLKIGTLEKEQFEKESERGAEPKLFAGRSSEFKKFMLSE